MGKLKIEQSKSLKLSNVISKILMPDEIENYALEVEKMHNYIKIKGVKPLGPIIQYTKATVNQRGEMNVELRILQQVNNYINNMDSFYKIDSVIRVKKCMYVRFIGEETKLKFAYDKINLEAFEEDIPLKGDSYTIFVDKQDDNMIADVFMERADHE
ncbi:hypothetical protein C8E03_10460 [Lachnotalea glycerini]|uniref:Uncharacterized protein n=1 Tax=Lachnotalea glycerini TaxID=1763509 RepID=A0A318ES36_9FIRM|nr:hypothetical protein [Lachnotalea glycerini]PXV91053.1 hypothetical protein C8E03_10460 [Lachnotalea glycerini]